MNPKVDHPRWSQATERRIGEFLRRKTLMFNGYGDQVATPVHRHGPAEKLLGEDSSDVLTDRALRFGLKPVVFVARSAPAAWLVWAAFTGNLSANPLSDLTNETGVWTLRFLCITLAITPLRRLTGWNAVDPFRRMVGLFAFFYGTLHFLTYVIADRFAGPRFPADGIVAWTTVRQPCCGRSGRTSTSGRSSPSASRRWIVDGAAGASRRQPG